MEIDRLSSLPDELLLIILRGLYPYDTKVGAKTATLSKRWRFLWIKLIDRLSALPDNLLVDILGRLYPYDKKQAAAAAKTATLSKRWRFLWTKSVDPLSALPDKVLVHILGRLDNTKEAARTALLSKRWRFLWTKLPLLSFRSDQRCFAGIRAALAARRYARLDLEYNYYCSLRLSLPYDAAFANDLVALLDFAARSGVRDVDLDLTAVIFRRSLPQVLYSYPSLRKLSLNFLNLSPPANIVEWELMTEISLYYVNLPQQAMDQIISGCPLLIRLKVDACWGFNRLDVRGRRFRELDVKDGFGRSKLLEISAPYMTSLKVYMNPQCTTLRLTDVSSVEQLRIAFWFYYDEIKIESLYQNEQLFQLFQHVTSLELYYGMFPYKVASNMRKARGQLPGFRVQHLTIETCIDTDNIDGVLAILESSSFLEKLVINDMSGSKKYWNPSVGADLLYLKSVEIVVNVELELTQEMSSFTLAQILLRRAPVLQEMIIIMDGMVESADCIELVEKFKTLHNYPKSSHKALVHISL